MSTKPRHIRLAMLNADTSIPNVYASLGAFGDILSKVLAAAISRVYSQASITHAVYNVVNDEYPHSLSDFDAVVITASAASAYDSKAWIRRLQAYVVMLYREHPRIKMFGSCFGHHLICQALLEDHGLRVEKHPSGWAIGISEVVFTNEFRQAFAHVRREEAQDEYARVSSRLPSPDEDENEENGSGCCEFIVPPKARLQFVHADQVVSSTPAISLAKSWILLGSTDHCAIQGVYQPGRVLTLQGHFEFDKFESRQTLTIFGADNHSVNGTEAECGSDRELEEAADEGELVAEIVVRFLVDDEPAKIQKEQIQAAARLPTPRTSTEIL